MSQTPPTDNVKSAPIAQPARLWALVPCAGVGSRAASTQPKQYQTVAGKPLVMHTLQALAGVSRLACTLVVVAPGDDFFDDSGLESAKFATLPPNLPASLTVVKCGGDTRAASVCNGLEALLASGADVRDWVLVHDAARCLVTPSLVNRLIDACLSDELGGLLALPLPDTLKAAAQGRVAGTLDRADKWLAQTPQMFRIGALQNALKVGGKAVTDESSAMEALGWQPRLVVGSAQNFKVTYPDDFALAEAVLTSRRPQPLTAEAGHSSQSAQPAQMPMASSANPTISPSTTYDYP